MGSFLSIIFRKSRYVDNSWPSQIVGIARVEVVRMEERNRETGYLLRRFRVSPLSSFLFTLNSRFFLLVRDNRAGICCVRTCNRRAPSVQVVNAQIIDNLSNAKTFKQKPTVLQYYFGQQVSFPSYHPVYTASFVQWA